MEAHERYISISIAEFLMKIVGFWHGETRRDKIILDIILSYTLIAIFIALVVVAQDFYYSWGDLYVSKIFLAIQISMLIENRVRRQLLTRPAARCQFA